MGIYSYKRDNKSNVNLIFFALCISASLWAIGFAFMLISSNIEIANTWRIVSALGWCFFNALWISFALSLDNTFQKKSISMIQVLIYILSAIFFIGNLMVEPVKIVGSESYGYADNLFITLTIGTVFSIYNVVLFSASIIIIYFQMRNALKNRVKKQLRTIFITSVISVCLAMVTDFILPSMGILVFPSAIITISIGMGGIWYAINKYKMMSISYELISEYIFEAVNEPIFILGENLFVKNCNKAALTITGFKATELKENSLDAMIDFRNFSSKSIIQLGNVTNIEVNLQRENSNLVVCQEKIFKEYKQTL